MDESHYGIEIGKIDVEDPNANENFTYEITGVDQNYFEKLKNSFSRLSTEF